MMRIVIAFFALLALAHPGLAQDAAQTPDIPVQVRALTIVSADLPEADRQQVIRCLQGGTYGVEELVERVRQNLRDLGYYSAQAAAPQLAAIHEAPLPRSAEVSIQVEPGVQYHLDNIEFQNASVFTADQLRQRFPIEAGSLFNASAIGKGLKAMKDLYLEKGYINFGAIPQPIIDKSRRVIDLTIEIDEGKPYDFGRLSLEGIEPRAGVAKALFAAWPQIEGKRYNPQLLANWLAANAPFLKDAENVPGEGMAHQNPDTYRVDIRLEFPERLN
jgi:outer membrane translocation and assembly module TamA